MKKILLIGIFVFVCIALYRSQNILSSEETECRNYREIEVFDNPVSVEWRAKADACVVSCWGAKFTRTEIDDVEYIEFVGYVPETSEEPISEALIQNANEVLIKGKWTNVGADHVFLFDGMCVPTVEIESIEILE